MHRDNEAHQRSAWPLNSASHAADCRGQAGLTVRWRDCGEGPSGGAQVAVWQKCLGAVRPRVSCRATAVAAAGAAAAAALGLPVATAVPPTSDHLLPSAMPAAVSGCIRVAAECGCSPRPPTPPWLQVPGAAAERGCVCNQERHQCHSHQLPIQPQLEAGCRCQVWRQGGAAAGRGECAGAGLEGHGPPHISWTEHAAGRWRTAHCQLPRVLAPGHTAAEEAGHY